MPDIIAYDSERASAYHRHHHKNLRTRISTARERQLAARALSALPAADDGARPRLRHRPFLAGASTSARRRSSPSTTAKRCCARQLPTRSLIHNAAPFAARRSSCRFTIAASTWSCACAFCTTSRTATIACARSPIFAASPVTARSCRCGPTAAARRAGGCKAGPDGAAPRLRPARLHCAHHDRARFRRRRIFRSGRLRFCARVCRCGASMRCAAPTERVAATRQIHLRGRHCVSRLGE